MEVISVAELSGWAPRELMSLYFQVGKQLVGTRMGSLERLAVEQTLANIRWVVARRHHTPRC
jgi:hypothetical protein